MKYDFLLQPIKIGGITIKNRIIMPSLNHSYSADGYVNERLIAYYAKKAQGGAGLITVGGCAIDKAGRSSGILCLYNDSFIPGFQRLTAAMREGGAKSAAQIYHAGGYAKRKDTDEEAIAPSAGKSRYTNEEARAMTVEDIKNTVEKFSSAAWRAKEAGFDAVELIGSAGYLIAEFLSSFTNKRTDEYGGSLENRVRFLLTIIQEIKNRVGQEYPLLVRLSGNDFLPGGNTNKEAVEIAKMITQAGVDAISVTGGWHESRIPQTTGELPPGGYSYLAKNIRTAVDIPVIASNRINTPEQAEMIIATGVADMVSMARALLADPDFPTKLAEGQTDYIRKCIACGQGCYDRRFSGKDVLCMVNYQAGRELEFQLTPTAKAKNILILGGGPAGMEFAINAAQRGHKITLWEKGSRLGGQLHYASVPEGKHDFHYLIDYQVNMLEKLNIKTELNKDTTAEDIAGEQPDVLVVATGSAPIKAPFPVERELLDANDVLAGKVIAGQKVVVIGGGAVGCETAVWLADQSTLSAEQVKFLIVHEAETLEEIKRLLNTPSRQVSIVEMQPQVGKDIGISTKWVVRKQLSRLGIQCLTETKVLTVTKEGVKVENASGQTSVIQADSVVLAIGSRAQSRLAEEMAGKILEIHVIGDAVKPGKIMDAITDAAQLAARM